MRVLTAGRGRVFVAGTLLLSLVTGSAAALCPGDCSRDGAVTIDELLTTVDIALGKTAMGACTLGDVDRDQRIAVDELVLGVGSALNGCPIASTVLIDEARRDGTLDEKTAALYELYARFAPERLPQAYRGAPSTNDSVSAAMVATAHLDEYAPAERAAVRAMLVAPSNPLFMQFPQPAPSARFPHVSTPVTFDCLQQFSGISLVFADPIVFEQVNGAPLTKYFRFIPAAPNQTEAENLRVRMLADLSEPISNSGVVGTSFPTLGAFFDAAFEYFVNDVGMSNPLVTPVRPSILDTAGWGGFANRIPVYIYDCPMDEDAFAYPEGHIVATTGEALRDPDQRRITLVHELFHILQRETAPRLRRSRDDNWPVEAAAVYMEDIVADDVQRWHRYPPPGALSLSSWEPMNRSFRCPEEPFHSDNEGICKHPRYMNGGVHAESLYRGSYSKFVFFKYLAARLGQPPTQFMAPFWRAFTGDVVATFDAVDWSQYIADFQVALIGDLNGQPTFSPSDRAAFAAHLDYRANDPFRYTFFVEPDRFTGPMSWRISPKDKIATAMPMYLETHFAPLPEGTHRWLINVPAKAAALADFELAAIIKSKLPNNPPVKVLLAPYDGHTIDVDAGATAPTLTGRLAVSKPSAQYIAVITSDPGNTGATLEYEGGLTLTRSCIDDCRPFYAAEATTQNCCEQRYAELQVTNPAEYAREVAACRTDAPKMTRPLCEYICNSTEKPYPAASFISPRDLGALVCAAGVPPASRDELSGLVQVPLWPTGFTCDEMLFKSTMTVRAVFGDWGGVDVWETGTVHEVGCHVTSHYVDGPLPIALSLNCGSTYADVLLQEPSPGVITLDGDLEALRRVDIHNMWEPYGTASAFIFTQITLSGPGTLTLEANPDWGGDEAGGASVTVSKNIDPLTYNDGILPGCRATTSGNPAWEIPRAVCPIAAAGDYLVGWGGSVQGGGLIAPAGHGHIATLTFTQ